MDSSLAQEMAGLPGSLLRHPGHAPRYLTHLPCWGRSPIDLELPCFSHGAIDILSGAVLPGHTVFEYGSGGSTAFLARRARSVHSVENDPAWHQVVTARAAKFVLANLHGAPHPLGDAEAHPYAELPYFPAMEGRQSDVILVDGFCGLTTGPNGVLRPHCFRLARAAIRPGGIIVVDDYWIYPEFAARAAGAKLTVFEDTGPCRYGVTSTGHFRF